MTALFPSRVTMALLLAVAFQLSPAGVAHAETFKVLYNFEGSNYHFYPDGANPQGALYYDNEQGKFFGTTADGGTSGLGTVFEIGPYGDGYKVLHSFRGVAGRDGANPMAGLTKVGGEFYGTTYRGGVASDNAGGAGGGAVYKINASGSEGLIYSFPGHNAEGLFPKSDLVADGAGDLFGTTANNPLTSGGIVFKVTRGGQKTVLKNFTGTGGSTGYQPLAGLVIGTDGVLYGTCARGGTSPGSGSAGTVFKITTTGANFSVLLNLDFALGTTPAGRLALDQHGNLFGTTQFNSGRHDGGASGYGSVFEFAPATGKTRLLRSFFKYDGEMPVAGVVVDSAGYIYGTTETGGSKGFGVVYKVKATDPSSFKLLHTFSGTDGKFPKAALALDFAGDVLGTTSAGGTKDKGVIFKISK